MCASALSDLSQLATASAAFKAAAAVLQTIADDTKRSSFHPIIPQMLQVSNLRGGDRSPSLVRALMWLRLLDSSSETEKKKNFFEAFSAWHAESMNLALMFSS